MSQLCWHRGPFEFEHHQFDSLRPFDPLAPSRALEIPHFYVSPIRPYREMPWRFDIRGNGGLSGGLSESTSGSSSGKKTSVDPQHPDARVSSNRNSVSNTSSNNNFGDQSANEVPADPHAADSPLSPVSTNMKRATQGSVHPNIKVDFPLRVIVGEPFKIDVWIEGEAVNRSNSFPVFMEQTDAISYKPRTFRLKPGERKTVVAQVLKTTAGLAQIQVTSDGYAPLIVDVDTGFKANIRAQVDDPNFGPSGIYGITLNLVDSQNVRVPLDTPIFLDVKATNALIRADDGGKWTTELTVALPKGATGTDLFQIKPVSIVGHPVAISTIMRLGGDGLVLHEDHLNFPVHPAWWFTLGLAMLGGVIPGLYRMAVTIAAHALSRRLVIRSIGQVLGGTIAGAGAYLLADLDVIGVKLDTSSPRSFCILGFLFAYVGLDVLMKKFANAKVETVESKDMIEPTTGIAIEQRT